VEADNSREDAYEEAYQEAHEEAHEEDCAVSKNQSSGCAPVSLPTSRTGVCWRPRAYSGSRQGLWPTENIIREHDNAHHFETQPIQNLIREARGKERA
jgi:hypothetical protein